MEEKEWLTCDLLESVPGKVSGAVPVQVAHNLPGHAVATVVDLGWASVKNGQLLALIEGECFDAFITCDKNTKFQQQLHKRPFRFCC